MLCFYDNSDMNVAEDDISVDDSPSRPKWAEKIVQAAGELAGNPQEPRKTRSQTSKASFASDSVLDEHCYMLIISEPQISEILYIPKMEFSNGR